MTTNSSPCVGPSSISSMQCIAINITSLSLPASIFSLSSFPSLYLISVIPSLSLPPSPPFTGCFLLATSSPTIQVIGRIFYTVNRMWNDRITAAELRKSNFLQVSCLFNFFFFIPLPPSSPFSHVTCYSITMAMFSSYPIIRCWHFWKKNRTSTRYYNFTNL